MEGPFHVFVYHLYFYKTLSHEAVVPFRCGIHNMFPLHLAALNAHSDCCRKLLSSGK